MTIFAVRAATFFMIEAENEEDAYRVGERYAMKAFNDDSYPSIDILREVKRVSELCYGWDDACAPYGNKDCTPLSELLPE